MKNNSSEKRNILLCVSGTTPQIITETLYFLTIVQKVRIDEIRVITTLDGRDKIMTGIIKERGGLPEESLLHPEKGQFFAFLRDYQLPGQIEFNETKIALLRTRDGRTLNDIRTPEENELAGDQICEIVREICKDDDVRLFASAAGGRKTMSIYLTAAMQLFGRAEDSLSHVLVSADFETNKHFFYPPPTPKILRIYNPFTKEEREVSTETAEIYLAPIPFIRLQGTQTSVKLPDGQTYGNLVDQAQNYLDKDERNLPLKLNLKTNELTVGNAIAKISNYELLLYVLFAEKKLNNKGVDGFVQLNSLSREDFEIAWERIMTARGNILRIDGNLRGTDWEFLLNVVEQAESNNPIDYDDFMNSVSRAFGRANKKVRKAGLPQKYEISAKGNVRPKKYGLAILKEQILFE